MPRYWNSYSQAYRDSDSTLGYPFIEEGQPGYPGSEPDESITELAAKTADAILADVGDDPLAAQTALDAENARETPRSTLVAKLEKIAAG